MEGTPITRFAMVHDDIVPESFYMDKLLEILDNTPDADLVAAACPIKDARGLVSTAIDDPNDEWEVFRRFTLPEIHELPETFCAKDTLYPDKFLLANTGCWVCRFDRPWRHKMFFEVRTRMVFVMKNGDVIPAADYREGMRGRFQNQVMPEDWLFSRLLGQLGGKVYITRTVDINHIGSYPYPSKNPSWAQWNRDEGLTKKYDMENGPPMISGWLTEAEGRLLAQLAAGKSVLEIGSWCGLSTVWMARKASMVIAVDTFDGTGTDNPRNTLREFRNNIAKYQVEDKVKYWVGPSRTALPDLAGFFDFAFIDGAHDPKSIQEDFDLVIRTIQHHPDALIAFHDYDADYPEVVEFVDNLLAGNYDVHSQAEALIVLKPKIRKIGG
jgi:predicted O-methyltransferase YrrM